MKLELLTGSINGTGTRLGRCIGCAQGEGCCQAMATTRISDFSYKEIERKTSLPKIMDKTEKCN